MSEFTSNIDSQFDYHSDILEYVYDILLDIKGYLDTIFTDKEYMISDFSSWAEQVQLDMKNLQAWIQEMETFLDSHGLVEDAKADKILSEMEDLIKYYLDPSSDGHKDNVSQEIIAGGQNLADAIDSIRTKLSDLQEEAQKNCTNVSADKTPCSETFGLLRTTLRRS